MSTPPQRPTALPFAALFATLIWGGLAALFVFTLVVLTRQARAQDAGQPLSAVTLTFRAPEGTAPTPRREGVTALAPGTALLTEIISEVEARQAIGEPFEPAAPGLTLGVGGGVRAGAASRARLDFDDGAVLRVGPDSEVALVAFGGRGGSAATALSLQTGQLWANLRSRPLEVHTSLGVATVYGAFAEFVYRPGRDDDPEDDVLIINCFQGPCAFQGETLNDIVGDLTRLTVAYDQPARSQPLTTAEVQAFIQVNPEAVALNALAGGEPAQSPTAAQAQPTEQPPEEFIEEEVFPTTAPQATIGERADETETPTGTPTATASPEEAEDGDGRDTGGGTATATATGTGTPGNSPTPGGPTETPTVTGTPGTPGTPSSTPGTPTATPVPPTATGTSGAYP